MGQVDYSKPVQMSEHVYWIGEYDEDDKFQCNPYLIIKDGIGVVIDPGSVLYFPKIINKITSLIPLRNIRWLYLNHQDPDVCGNAPLMLDAINAAGNNTCDVITHSRNAALVKHYGLDIDFMCTDRMPGEQLLFSDGQALKFIHTPYLHSPGATAVYFTQDKVLFSGDLFGGETENWTLFAGPRYEEQIASFHESYMPAKELLLFSMLKFEEYDIEMIAPQHGSIIDRDQAGQVMNLFKDFDCGLFIDKGFRDELSKARKRIDEQNRIMSEELVLAANFQKALLPDTDGLNINERLDIDYYYKPCNQVSGDFLIIDYVDAENIGVMMVDVMGHGVKSGLATMQIKTLFNEYKGSTTSPAQLLGILNKKIFSMTESALLMTAIYCIINKNHSECRIASAGGVPPILIKGDSEQGDVLPVLGYPLGISPEDYIQPDELEIVFDPGDLLVVQTDGLIESTNSVGESYDSISSQKRVVASAMGGGGSRQIVTSILQDHARFVGADYIHQDDISMAVIRRV